MARKDPPDTKRHSNVPAPVPPPEDIESGLRFLHLSEAQTKAHLAEVSATVTALVELLVGAGHLPIDAYEKRKRLTMLRENERASEEANIALSNIPDKYALEGLPQIDCAKLLPLCQARCCHLRFPLSVQDLDERIVRWTYGAPYYIAQRPDGSCVHLEKSGGCGVYENRPGVCRAFDCRNDKRIWIDFERRIPAP